MRVACFNMSAVNVKQKVWENYTVNSWRELCNTNSKPVPYNNKECTLKNENVKHDWQGQSRDHDPSIYILLVRRQDVLCCVKIVDIQDENTLMEDWNILIKLYILTKQ